MEEASFSNYFTNSTMDYTDQYENIEDNQYLNIFQRLKVPIIISYSITFILGTIGNGLVIWIAGFRMKKTVDILWFLNLAVADFAFDILFPLQITEWIMDGHWPLGQIMCKIIFTVLFLNMSVSTSFLMIISLDRCTSVMCPVWSKNHRTLKLASIISSMVWSCCFLLSSPYLAFFDIVHDSDTNISYCIPMYAEDHHTGEMRYKVMFIARFIFMFIIPFSIIIICYSLITSRLRRIRSRSGSSRPFKVIVTIVLCFFCFWFPFHLWPFVNDMNIEISSNVDIVMTQVVYCIGFFNSCVNPIVYVFVGRDFKKSLFKSIPFLLESTFRERYETEADHQYDHTMVATEMETFNA